MTIIEKIENNPIYKFFERIYTETSKAHIFLIASGISFNILLYVIPLLLMVVYVITIFFEPEYSLKLIDKLLKEALPRKLYSREYFKIIETEINYLFEYRSYFGIFGIAIILWLSSALVSSLRYGLNLIFEIKEGTFGFLYRFKDVFVTILFTILILLYAFVLPILKLVLNFIDQIEFEFIRYYLSGFVINSITISIAVVLYLLIYRLVPSRNIGFKLIISSTTLTVLFQELFSYLFTIYIVEFNSFGKVYGSLGIIIAIAVWLYYSSLIILFSSILSKVIFSKSE